MTLRDAPLPHPCPSSPAPLARFLPAQATRAVRRGAAGGRRGEAALGARAARSPHPPSRSRAPHHWPHPPPAPLPHTPLLPLPPRAGKYRSTDAAKGAPFVWVTGPSRVRQLVWLSPKIGLAHGSRLIFELSSLAPALGLPASFSSSYKQTSVRIVGSAGWNDGIDVQFPAALRDWECVTPALALLLTISEATRSEAQHVIDANAALGK